MNEICVVFCTCPDGETAEVLAEGLLEQQLAACVNILPGIRSIYRWKGRVARDSEALMVIKTAVSGYASLQSWLREHHPYDVPEVLALPVRDGLADYLAWVSEETK